MFMKLKLFSILLIACCFINVMHGADTEAEYTKAKASLLEKEIYYLKTSIAFYKTGFNVEKQVTQQDASLLESLQNLKDKNAQLCTKYGILEKIKFSFPQSIATNKAQLSYETAKSCYDLALKTFKIAEKNREIDARKKIAAQKKSDVARKKEQAKTPQRKTPQRKFQTQAAIVFLQQQKVTAIKEQQIPKEEREVLQAQYDQEIAMQKERQKRQYTAVKEKRNPLQKALQVEAQQETEAMTLMRHQVQQFLEAEKIREQTETAAKQQKEEMARQLQIENAQMNPHKKSVAPQSYSPIPITPPIQTTIPIDSPTEEEIREYTLFEARKISILMRVLEKKIASEKQKPDPNELRIEKAEQELSAFAERYLDILIANPTFPTILQQTNDILMHRDPKDLRPRRGYKYPQKSFITQRSIPYSRERPRKQENPKKITHPKTTGLL